MAVNHWYYLSPQYLWGFPKGMTHVKVRANFEADIENPHVTTYIWFLCNGYGGPGHFVQLGIGMRHLGQGPVRNGSLPIPQDVMDRLQQGFDHWFEWQPVTLDANFQNQVLQLPIPKPTFIPTLRRVTADHLSFPLFEAILDDEERRIAAIAATSLAAASASSASTIKTAAINIDIQTIENDLENLRREQSEPRSQGHIYLIHMKGTMFYKIGMSLDPQLRMRTLQTGNPHPLQILTTQLVQDMRGAEINLHRQFEGHRVPNLNVREWFDFSDGIGEVEAAFDTLLPGMRSTRFK
ncbi:hypothetical protein MMC19_002085 [Ptychographa xylographoides]|nr:hypothetical protein [Ptychographa xylographoides]